MDLTTSNGSNDAPRPGGGIVARVAGFFGALMVVTIAALLAVWLYGLPAVGVPGAREVHLAKARQALEISADSRVTQIEMALRERRGDLRLLAENLALERELVARPSGAPRADAGAETAAARRLRAMIAAYPDTYERLLLLTTDSGRMLAASDGHDSGQHFADSTLLERLLVPGVVEHIETVDSIATGERKLLIARQVLERDALGVPTGKLLGVLVATVATRQILGSFDRAELRSLGDSGSVSLFDRRGPLATFRLLAPTDGQAGEPAPPEHGLEGSFIETGGDGRAILASYRFVPIGAGEGWTLVVRRGRDEAIAELTQRATRLLLVGLLFTAGCLVVVVFAARQLTRPIRRLASVAQRLADGDLGARVALAGQRASDEVSALGITFNNMAGCFEAWHATLAREVDTRTRELQQEKETAQRYLDVAGVILMVLDRSGRIALINAKGCELLGCPESELLGADWFSRFIPAPQVEAVRAAFVRLMSGESVAFARYENEIINATGEARIIDWRNILLTAASGEIQGVLSSGDDITERRLFERQLNDQQVQLEVLVAKRTADLTAALAAAELADRAKDAFLANVSHELRTPLNAVIGLAGLARRLGTDARQRDYLDKIAGAGTTLARLIDDLLDLSKIVAGHLEFERCTFSLRGVVERSSSVIQHRAAAKGLKLSTRIADDVPDVLVGDPLRVEQILLNLLSNAVKFTDAGRIGVGIGVHQRNAQRVCLEITVDDTGVGIADADLPLLFEPFSQGDATMSRKFGGTGLGLAICRRLTEAMEGDIQVSSQPGQGSSFRVRVWLDLGTAEDVAATPTDDALPADYGNARVLVVEDQPINREIVEALLAEVGITPTLAVNGRQALDLLRAAGPQAFDLVLMDLQMPVMDGLTATRELRADSEFRDLPIIAMTAHTMAHEKEISAAAGMNDHLGKPFAAGAFHRLLRKWLVHAAAPAQAVSPASPGRPEVPALPAIDGIDTQEGLRRFAGNDARYRHWLNDFVDESASVVATIAALLADGRRDQARQAAHAFKGRVGVLGMTELHALAAALEQAISAGEAVGEIEQQLTEAIAGMRGRVRAALPMSSVGAAPLAATPHAAAPLPPAIAAVLRLLEAADGSSAAAIEACLAEFATTGWPPLLRAALAQVRRFDFEAARQVLAAPRAPA